MQVLPLLAQILRAFASPPARSQLAARTLLWAVAGLLTLAGTIFALIGTYAFLSVLMSPVAASFALALMLFLSAGLLGLGAWLSGPPRAHRAEPQPDLAILLAGFLEGLAHPPPRTHGSTGDNPERED